MKFGINTFLFTSPFTNDSIKLFPKFKKWGFDSVEIALEDPSQIDPKKVKQALDDNGLTCNSICAAMGTGRDLRGNKDEQNTSADYLKGVMDVMPLLGSKVLAGPLYSSVGRAEPVTRENYKKQWDTVVGNFQILADYAVKQDVILAIEPLNRYETDFINTCEQGLKMINDVNNASLLLHLDSFHMNIEEKDMVNSIIKAGPKLAHFHACGSDRGTPGGDLINWDRINNAFKSINYTGNIVIESFTTDVKVIAKAASIWRKLEPSQEDIALKGLIFLKTHLN